MDYNQLLGDNKIRHQNLYKQNRDAFYDRADGMVQVLLYVNPSAAAMLSILARAHRHLTDENEELTKQLEEAKKNAPTA